MINLYNNLISLCDTSDKSKFYYKDVKSPFGTTLRIFNYNYASYTDWCKPDALECRGIMFVMEDGLPVRIAARPMEKFFNLGETPFTMNLDYTKIVLATAKEDGSLISSFVDCGTLLFKSKGSIYSPQAQEALQVIRRNENEAFRERIKEITADGYTCNLEYVAPTNRVVLEYQERALVLLNIRCNDTGEYVPYSVLHADGALRPYLVEGYTFDTSNLDFIKEIQSQEGIEGFIFEMENGLRFKLKTEWYSALHHTKDSINNNTRLYEAIVAGASDDMKGLFIGDVYANEKIEYFEEVHRQYLAEAIQDVETVYEQVRGKERRDYAIEAQDKLRNKNLFNIVMQSYNDGLDYETLVDKINKVFLKNHKLYIPDHYKVIPESQE